jgi:uncharacterized protein (DUF58 family)
MVSLAELVDMRHAARRIEQPPGRALATCLAGPYRSALTGRGMDFEEVRAYQEGDDVRGIDWRVTARTGRTHSKVYREERERPVWVYTDLAPGMHFGTRCAFKSVAAARAAALIAWSARRSGDRVGALVRAPSGARIFRPRAQESQLFQILGALARGTADESEQAAETSASCLSRLANAVRTGSRVVLLSDFSDLDEAGRRDLARLARRADVSCVLVFDPIETEPPPSGTYRVSDGQAVLSIDTSGRRFREAYCERFAARLAALTELCRKHRIDLVPLQTVDDPVAVIGPSLAPKRRAA